MGFLSKTLYAGFLYTIRATCTAHHILLYFITQIIFGDQYKSYSYSLRSLIQPRYLAPFRPKYLPRHLILEHLQFMLVQEFPTP